MAEPTDQAEQLALALKALSVIRHDLRNLLASVTIMAGRMERSEDERLVKAAPLLVSSMERTVSLGVRAGLLAELGPEDRQAVPLSRALSAADPDERAAASVGDLAVLADEAQLVLALAELVDNAARTEAAPRVEAEKRGSNIEIRVGDSGSGIPEYAQGDLFTPFKGAKRRDGTGLGLPIAARVATLNGGTLTLEETGEGGSVFRLELKSA